MAKLKVAVLGASRIGKFHAREFEKVGAKVVAILGRTKDSAETTAKSLKKAYGIEVTPHTDLAELLKKEKIQAVSICTPDKLHYSQVKECLQSGVNVISEKPLVFESDYNNTDKARELIKIANTRKLIITVNTQWPSVLSLINSFADISNVKEFSMFTEPRSIGKDMLIEQLSHQNSLLVRLVPQGHISNITFPKTSLEEIQISFLYKNEKSGCKVNYHFTHKKEGIRNLGFSINGVMFKREVDEVYRQKLVFGEKEIKIEDPFAVSISMFVKGVQGQGSPLISQKEIIENISLQDTLVKAYLKTTI